MYDGSRCETCKRKFGSQQAAIQHMNSFKHWGPRLECDTDGRKSLIQRVKDLYLGDKLVEPLKDTAPKQHETNPMTLQAQDDDTPTHPVEEPGHPKPQFQCKSCKKNFNSQSAVNQHMEDTRHQGPRFQCETCDAKFNSESAANQHMDAKKHQKRFQCPDCSKGFQSENALNMVCHPSQHERSLSSLAGPEILLTVIST